MLIVRANNSKRRNEPYHRGFTIPEMLVTMVIFSFLAMAVNMVLIAGNSSWQVNSTEVELQQDLRQAMDRLISDLQQTGSASLSIDVPINPEADPVTYPDPDDDPAFAWNTYTTFSFQTVTGTTNGVVAWNPNATTYDFNGTNLQRTVGSGDPVVVAENIQSLDMRRLFESSDIVEIALAAEKKTLSGAIGRTISLTLDFKVQMRN